MQMEPLFYFAIFLIFAPPGITIELVGTKIPN